MRRRCVRLWGPRLLAAPGKNRGSLVVRCMGALGALVVHAMCGVEALVCRLECLRKAF